MEWQCIKEFPLDPIKDQGTYLILVGASPKISYYCNRRYERSWHIPDFWKDPTHYIKIPSIKNYYSNIVFDGIIHD